MQVEKCFSLCKRLTNVNNSRRASIARVSCRNWLVWSTLLLFLSWFNHKKKNKGVRKKTMIFSTAYLVEEPHKQGEKLRQTSSWVQALWRLLHSLSNVSDAVLNEDFIPKFATWIAAERQKYDTGNDVIGYRTGCALSWSRTQASLVPLIQSLAQSRSEKG